MPSSTTRCRRRRNARSRDARSLALLQPAMEDWFRRKGYLKPGERLDVAEMHTPPVE